MTGRQSLCSALPLLWPWPLLWRTFAMRFLATEQRRDDHAESLPPSSIPFSPTRLRSGRTSGVAPRIYSRTSSSIPTGSKMTEKQETDRTAESKSEGPDSY